MKSRSRKADEREIRIQIIETTETFCRHCKKDEALDYCINFCPIGRSLREMGRQLDREKPIRGKRPAGKRLDDNLPPLKPINPRTVTPAAINKLKRLGYTNKTIGEAAGRTGNWLAYHIDKWRKRGMIS